MDENNVSLTEEDLKGLDAGPAETPNLRCVTLDAKTAPKGKAPGSRPCPPGMRPPLRRGR